MKKFKQILAIIGIVFLFLLYCSTLICAIIDHTQTMRLFQASIMATVIIPVLLWAYSFVYKLVAKNHDDVTEDLDDKPSLKDKANISSSDQQ